LRKLSNIAILIFYLLSTVCLVAGTPATPAQHDLSRHILEYQSLCKALQVATCEEEHLLLKQIAVTKQKLKPTNLKKADFNCDTPVGCPEIEVIELIGIPGFSQTDELMICGASDTLAFLIYIEEPGTISGTQMSVDFKPGMQYAGYELTEYAGTDITVVDPTPEKPRFLLDGITDGVYVGYIGVDATCDADINALTYSIDLKFNFIYEDTCGNFYDCQQFLTPERTYNTVIREPVLNFQTVSHTTVAALGIETCTDIVISQDGIDAYLNDFNFAVCGLDFSDQLQLTSVSANGTPLPYNYDASTQILDAVITGDYFNDNTNPNPADSLFDTGERTTVRICYLVEDCPLINTYPIQYKMDYGCFGDQCQSVVLDREIRIRPSIRPTPIAEVDLIQNPGVCGNNGIIELKVYSNNSDPQRGLFTDLSFGFETCEKPSLEVARVLISGTPLADTSFSWVNDDINIDLSGLTFDPDGPGGITDFDGDGFFDDLPGGDTARVQIEIEFTCVLPPSASSIQCGVIFCDFAQFYVEADRDCGQAFKFYPTITGFSITNGAVYQSTNETEVSSSFFGFDFGATGTSGPKTKTVEFCYVYDRENVTACEPANTSNKLQVLFAGSGGIVHDVEINPATIMVDINGVNQITGATVTWDSIDQGTRLLEIDAGVVNIGDTVCYRYELTVDTFLCAPFLYMDGVHQVIETCETGTCTCESVKACESMFFRSNPNDTGCSCSIIGSVEKMYRETTGYTDETMTTKVNPADVPAEDRNRYLPCDTIFYEAAFHINTEEALGDIYEWGFGVRVLPLSGGALNNVSVVMDAKKTELVSFELKKVGSSTRTVIDFSDIPSCHDPDPSTYRISGITTFFGTSPWEGLAETHFSNENTNSSFDWYDNSRVYFQIRNQTKLQECRGVDYSSWENNGNCWDDFNAKYGFEVGDTLFVAMRIPLIKNPFAVVEGEAAVQTPRVYQDIWASRFDEFDPDCLVGTGVCRENIPFETYCPSDVVARTELIIDDCGGTAEHFFSVENTTPNTWYANEYRPYFDLQDLSIPIYSPLMFCGNAKLVTKGGIEYPLSIQDTINHTCATVNGQLYCSVSGASPGTIVLNPESAGYTGLGVGLGGLRDTARIVYDLCVVCPGDLANLSDYTLVYDYAYPCETPNGDCYRCNFAAATGLNNELDECLNLGNGAFYYNIYELDTLIQKEDRTSQDVLLTDNRNGFPDLEQTVDKELISSLVPGTSEELNDMSICADDMGPTTIHRGVLATVTLANSVQLANVYEADMTPIPFTYVSTDGTSNTYRFSLADLAPGDCIDFKIGTTLLFCPFPPLPSPEICVTVTSGCMDADVQAAVAGNTAACNTNEKCYLYTFGEASIQGDIIAPGAGTEHSLCDSIPVAILIKNVKAVTVTDLMIDMLLPIAGASVVLGSFEASYPNAGDLNGTFYPIANPTINGNQILYTEDNDFSNAIHSMGFPGVTSSMDSNNIVIRFLMETECDAFTSGSQIQLKGTATDPCSPDLLSTGQIFSDPVIITGANPKDFAQILTTAEPAVAYCNAIDNEFTVTGLNISDAPSGDSVQICLTFPPELEYEPGSVGYVLPTGQSVGMISSELVGGLTQVCFAGVNNLPVGGQFTLTFRAKMMESAMCGKVDLGVAIKELVLEQTCTDGGECDVFVQTSVNPNVGIELKAPIETVNLKFTRACTDTEDPITLCYEVNLHNPGPDYMGEVRVDLHDDLIGNNELDYYDPILGSDVYSGQFIAAGDTIMLTGCFEVEAINACPVLFNMVYETPCVCDQETTPYFEVSPEFVVNLPPTTVLCPGQEIGIETCGNYTFELGSSDAYMRTVGDSIYFGMNDPTSTVSITIDGSVGECPSRDVRFIKGLIPFDFYLQDTLACIDQPKFLQLVLPVEYADDPVIQWSPTTYLNTPTISDPIFNAPAAGIYTYDVSLTFGDGCVLTEQVQINVLPNTLMSIGGDTLFCLDFEPATLTTDAGYDSYEWYLLRGGFEIISGATLTNSWTGPTVEGDYIVKGYRPGDLCPAISGIWTIRNDECVDVELTKTVCNLDPKATLGDTITYCVEVCNILDPDKGLTYSVTSVEVADYWPTNSTYLTFSASSGSYLHGTPAGTWQIPVLAAGQCETLMLYGRLDQEGSLINISEVTLQEDYPDVDSEENNDDGDQSEDEEDKVESNIVFPRASIGDYVWHDANQNGIQESTESPMPGVAVSLYDANTGMLLATQNTDSNGEYIFSNLLLGDYYIAFDIMPVAAYDNYVATIQDGTSDDMDSDIGMNWRTDNFRFDPCNGDDLNFDAGFHLECKPAKVQIFGN